MRRTFDLQHSPHDEPDGVALPVAGVAQVHNDADGAKDGLAYKTL
jgi:hypothetical protein